MGVGPLDITKTTLQNLGNTSNQISLSLQSLSSGKKAELSPAALVQTESFNAQLDSLNQALANTQDAVNLVQTAQGGYSAVSDLVQNIQTAAVAAANTGANDPAVTQAYQAQISASVQAIQNIASQTQFGGRTLLDGSAGPGGVTLQIGPNDGQTVSVPLSSVQPSQLGTGVVPGASLAQIDVTTTSGAAGAIAIAQQALAQVTTQNAQLGALQANTLQPNVQALHQQIAAVTETNSRLSDTDIGATTTQLSSQLLQQKSGLAVLAQANAASSQVLTLLAVRS